MPAPVPPTRYCAGDSHIYRVDGFSMVGPTGREINAYGGHRLCDDAQALFEPLWATHDLGDHERAEVNRLAASRTGCLDCADLYSMTPEGAKAMAGR